VSDLTAELVRRLVAAERRLERLEAQERRYTGPGVVAYNNADITITTGDANQWLTFNSEVRDDDNMHSASVNTGRLTATRPGWYYVYAQVTLAGNATGRRLLLIRDSNARIAAQTALVVNTNPVRLNVSMLTYLVVNDYVSVRAFQNSGGDLNILYSAGESPYFGMVRVS
jgi:hypothetical protein